MSIFARPHYTSEATQFLDKLKQDRPALDAQQRAGRALLWDKPVDRALWQEYRAGRVPQKSYVYYSYSEENK
ncbi:MAG: DUF3460 family protein [Simplicispira sp.]|jgi:hypothetical protein|nr:DUF3460 family protein [Simplicispira sp.]